MTLAERITRIKQKSGLAWQTLADDAGVCMQSMRNWSLGVEPLALYREHMEEVLTRWEKTYAETQE